MVEEQNFDLIGWWNEQSFPGKELFTFLETGEIILPAGNNIRERSIGTVSAENADPVFRNLVEKFASAEARVLELELEWQNTEDKTKLADKVASLKEYIQHLCGLGNFSKLTALIHDWEHTLYTITEANYAIKLKLAELAEELAAGDQWKETQQALKEISDKFKQSGQVDKNRNDKLWNRIDAARKSFSERKRLHHEDEEKDLLHNLDLKIDLVEQAEGIAASEDWKKTTEAFHRLTDEWKTIGHTVNKKNEELWLRFQAAKSTFFEKKREHAARIQVEQDANYTVKLAIAEKAEALKDSTEWNKTAQAFATLMDEWKQSGRVQHDKGEELWKRFIGAKEHFYAGRKVHMDSERAFFENNYTQKKAIFDRAEELKHSNQWSEATSEMMQLLEDWKKIGPVPRSYGDQLWDDFNAVRKYFFARKDANREQRKQYAESQKSARAQYAKDTIVNLQQDIKEEEEKLADFKNALENITPGKKAAELKDHLEKLIIEGTQKLKKLNDKYKQAQKDIGAESVKEETEQGA
jgi:HAMP domain-containing protein